jgi:DNA primase
MQTVDNYKIQLKKQHREWLNNRGISDEVIGTFHLSSETKYNRIVIPVRNYIGKTIFNKYRRDPASEQGEKYSYDYGGKVTLFNSECLYYSDIVIICEGELDVMVLKTNGFNAVTSTGGALSFQRDWTSLFSGKRVYVCLDNDHAGRMGTIRICELIPEAKVIPLPGLKEHGDVTDYFMAGNTKKDFEILMSVAEPLVFEKKEVFIPEKKYVPGDSETDRIKQAKAIPIDTFLKFNHQGKAKCPFHIDHTPSLQRYPNNTWHCFSCGAGRDTIDFVMKTQELSFNKAIDYLLKE